MAERDSREIDRLIATMRVGFTGFMYPAPDHVDFDARAAWQLERSAQLGATCLQVVDLPQTAAARQDLAAAAASLDIELEGLVRALFVPLGEDPSSREALLAEQLACAKEAGLGTVRHGWGRLTLATSRYSPERNAEKQKAHIVRCLKSAARIAEDAGVQIAVENHCDFYGRELAQLLREVDSPWIGCALDTGNGYAVVNDANQDVEALAGLAVTTHIKDMRMIQNPLAWAVPFLPVGCRLGEGSVDIPNAIRLLAERSPKAEGLHLIVEAGWEPEGDIPEAVVPPLELRIQILEHGVGYLRQLVTAAGQSKTQE
ncbi:MAG: sugar phosphate isomerase/epimerase [Propionibacteriaceae bacterium]|jgi:sugar phosphate isomerase/epimerase|nr:sugar phosphate isomerase/epimerase [Propionibacteriaceae bacterium]